MSNNYFDKDLGDYIDKKYKIPVGEISCPGCGQKYGHHKTKVDIHSQECSTCVKKMKYKDVEFVDGDYFIQKYLDIKPFY